MTQPVAPMGNNRIGMQRTSQQIFRDLAQLHMIGALDEQARNALIAELQATSDF